MKKKRNKSTKHGLDAITVGLSLILSSPVLELYSTRNIGLEKIAYQLTEEGWVFRDRSGAPRTIWHDDIRRITANWAEYGDIIIDQKAKDRKAYKKFNVDEIPFRADRVVFPVELLRAVARIRQERSRNPANDGVR